MGLAELSKALASGRLRSTALVEEALAAIAAPGGEGAASFLQVHADSARAAAATIDAQRAAGRTLPPLAGIPISLKDLFNEAGVTTLGGSRAFIGQPAATQDAPVVRLLREAGMVIVGRTNMVEFAYSGLGVNPHYGTPRCVFDRAAGRIPGGSTSGGAISVADGMSVAAIGSDTGGSLRIPAALNGLVGFKPTQNRVSLEGVMPLASSFDSAGAIARSVEDCALMDAVLAGQPVEAPAAATLSGLRFAVPRSYFLDDLSPAVAQAFERALARLSAAGATIVQTAMPVFQRTPEINPRGLVTAVEALEFHRGFIATSADRYDPRVLGRIRTAESALAVDYAHLLRLRRDYIAEVERVSASFDALLMPTTPDTAPTIAEVTASDESYYRWNGRMLRNPSAVNVFDGCALSIPCHEAGAAPVGLMVAGTAGTDIHVLAVGRAIEAVVAPRAG
ncbi:amidase [Xylophilus rhododendri]|uniref:Amidase n=1 Tax=Xylophilus rhododendri TaxID=2697032 RepID=A0A857J3I2_9BURK|nr:amidase [Xylophilus rhododendri]QHI97611.1 amidase [Xylophilus rhododendri]